MRSGGSTKAVAKHKSHSSGAVGAQLRRTVDTPERPSGVRGFGFVPLLRPCVPRLIIDNAAPSVAHYGPVEVLRLPVGRLPDDETANHREMLVQPPG
jgi:hypothetical protein